MPIADILDEKVGEQRVEEAIEREEEETGRQVSELGGSFVTIDLRNVEREDLMFALQVVQSVVLVYLFLQTR